MTAHQALEMHSTSQEEYMYVLYKTYSMLNLIAKENLAIYIG